MTNQKNTEVTIDLIEVARVLLRRWWIIVLSTLIIGLAALGYTRFFIDPLYKASTLMYVNNSDISLGSTSFTISNADLTATQKLVNTYVVILKSRTALNEVIEEAGVDYTYEQMKSMISAAAVNSTEVFEIVVTSKSPAEAELIANTIADVLPDKISAIVSGSDVRIVDYAVIPAHRSSPSYTRNTAIGLLLGFLVSAAALIITYMLDENIRTEDYLTSTYSDIPLLAVIPDMIGTKQRSGGYYGYGSYYKKPSSQEKKPEAKSNETGAQAKQTAAAAQGKRG